MEFGSQFEDTFRNTDAKEGRAKSTAFREAAENFNFVLLVNEGTYTYAAGVFFQ